MAGRRVRWFAAAAGSAAPAGSAVGGRAERGAGTVLVLGVVSVGFVLLVAVTEVSSAVVARHRAQAAADFAALAAAMAVQAAVAAPCAEGARMAAANGAELIACTAGGAGSVEVRARAPAGRAVGWFAVASARAGPA